MAEENDTTITKDQYDKLEGKHHKAVAEIEDLKRKLKEFEGVDLSKLKAAAEEVENLKRDKAGQSPEDLKAWKEDQLKKIRDEVAKELATANDLAEKLKKENKELRVTDKVFQLAAGKFNEDCHEEVKEKIRQVCDLDDEGNIIIKDRTGNIRYLNGNKPMGPEDFITELSTTKPSWAVSTFTGGGKQNGQTVKSTSFDNITSLEQLNKLPNPKEALAKMSPEQVAKLAANLNL